MPVTNVSMPRPVASQSAPTRDSVADLDNRATISDTSVRGHRTKDMHLCLCRAQCNDIPVLTQQSSGNVAPPSAQHQQSGGLRTTATVDRNGWRTKRHVHSLGWAYICRVLTMRVRVEATGFQPQWRKRAFSHLHKRSICRMIQYMKLIAQLKLQPTSQQGDALKRTLEASNAACNSISDVAWQTHTFGKFDLQKLCYEQVRETFGLSAQATIRALAKVGDASKLDKQTKRTFRSLASVAYDDRILSYNLKGSTVSI